MRIKFPTIDLDHLGRYEICTRKYDGETYTFYLNVSYGVVSDGIIHYISCDTPENGLGYEDVVLHDTSADAVYSIHRYHPNWIMRKIHTVMDYIASHYNIKP